MTASALQEIDVALPLRKWQRYSDYKPIGLPWLPKAPTHWSAKRLRYVVRFPTKGEVRGLPLDTLVSFVPMEAIGEYGGLSLDQTRPIEEVLNGYTYFRNGDVLVAKITPCFENGKGVLAEGLENGLGFGTTELHVLRPGAEILPKYLFYLTLGEHFRKLGTAEMYGAGGQKRVPEQFIQNLKHPLPPLDEQRAIAAFLDRETAKIDELIAKKQRLIELLKEKRQAVISRAVTKGLDPTAPMKPSGIDWLGDVPAHWKIRSFRYSARIANGQVDPEQPEYRDLPLIAPNHIESGTGRLLSYDTAAEQAAESGKYLFEPGNVLYSKIRPALAKVCLAPERGLCSADMYPITPRNDLRPLYLMYFMLSAEFTTGVVLLSSRVAMPKMNRRDLGGFAVLVPPLGEQDEIIQHLCVEHAKIDTTRAAIEMAIDKLRQYRSAIITAAVTGQIDVRNYHAEAIS
jgi:type I restriction enzyme S subunit